MNWVNKAVLLIILIILVIPITFSQKIEINEFVNDYADIINPEEQQQLNSILKQIYDSGIAQYSIVTINSLEDQDIESYSLNLAQGNLGDSEKNNGLLLLVSLEDRKYRFEVGRGIEYILNDAKVGRIGRYYLVPNFKEENYGKGIVEASLAVRSILLGDVESEYYVQDSPSSKGMSSLINLFILFFFVLLPLSGIFLRKKRSDNRYFNAALGAAILMGGRGGGGLGGGGFGGFGGGGFGGGGASGGW